MGLISPRQPIKVRRGASSYKISYKNLFSFWFAWIVQEKYASDRLLWLGNLPHQKGERFCYHRNNGRQAEKAVKEEMPVAKKKGRAAAVLLAAAAIVILAGFIVVKPWDPVRKNTRALAKNMESLKTMESGTKISLSEYTPFSWEAVYSFDPYTSKEEMEAVIHTECSDIQETINEGMTQLIFLSGGRVVASVCGYGENLGYSVDLGQWEDGRNYRRISSGMDVFTLYNDGEYSRLVFEGETFTGTIEKIYENGMAEVAIDEEYANRTSDRAHILLPEELQGKAAEGNRVQVTYDGWVAETYPVQIPGLMKVRLEQ